MMLYIKRSDGQLNAGPRTGDDLPHTFSVVVIVVGVVRAGDNASRGSEGVSTPKNIIQMLIIQP